MKTTTLKSTIAIISFGFMLSTTSCKKEIATTELCNDVKQETKWSNDKEGVDYIISCPVTVSALLTIEPGTEIEFRNGAGIIVESTGSIKAVGTANAPIVLRGSNDTKGTWKGIFIKSNNVTNEFKYCTITGAGQSSFDGTDIKANLRLTLSSKVKISNTTISNSAKDGIYTEGFDSDFENPIDVFSSNTITDNGNYPISTLASTITVMDGMNTIYNKNTKEYINVRGGRMYGDHVWNKTQAPILITGYTIAGYYNNTGNLTVNAGVQLIFDADQGIANGEYSTGYIKIEGNPNTHAILIGLTPVPSAWKGICFQSNNPNNKLNYVDISYGGSSSFTGNTSHLANICVGGYSSGKVTITNCTVNNSGAYGILIGLNQPEPTISNVTYSGNALADYYVEQ